MIISYCFLLLILSLIEYLNLNFSLESLFSCFFSFTFIITFLSIFHSLFIILSINIFISIWYLSTILILYSLLFYLSFYISFVYHKSFLSYFCILFSYFKELNYNYSFFTFLYFSTWIILSNPIINLSLIALNLFLARIKITHKSTVIIASFSILPIIKTPISLFTLLLILIKTS